MLMFRQRKFKKGCFNEIVDIIEYKLYTCIYISQCVILFIKHFFVFFVCYMTANNCFHSRICIVDYTNPCFHLIQ
jgi:hypothetical protein